MATITKNTDGDTFRIDGESTRVLGINTDESVAVHSARNTDSGRAASTKAKAILPEGTEVTTEGDGSKGKFGRTLADVKIQTAQGEVDYGLVALDQGMSQYSTDYGEHPDPEQHDVFKEYYSEAGPYQYGEAKEPLSTEDYARVGNNIAAFTDAEAKYQDGDITRQEYEAAMHTAYGNGKEVAQYRYQNNQWQRDFNMKDFDGSDRLAYDWAHQTPEQKEAYNRAVKNSDTGMRTNPEQSEGFWKSLWSGTKTSFSALNDMALLSRQIDLNNAREYADDDFDVPDEELIKGVPEAWHTQVMQEAERYGDDAALQYRDNLLTDLQNEKAMEEMPLAVQIATAVPAVLVSPTTLLGGGLAAKGAVAANKTIAATLAVGRNRLAAIPAKVAVWSVAGGVEAGVSALPRLAATETYTSTDMLNEIKFGAALGGGLSVLGTVGSKVKGVAAPRYAAYRAKQVEVHTKIQAETERVAAEYQQRAPKAEPITHSAVEAVDEVEMSTQLNQTTQVAEGEVAPAVVTNEHLNYLDNAAEGIPQVQKSAEEVAGIEKAVKDSREALTVAADKRVDEVLKQVTVPYKRGKTSTTVDKTTGALSKSLTQSMLESESAVSRFVGSELLELPEGLGGKVIRRPSAALQQHSLKTRYLSQTQPSYHKLIGEYAGERGKRGVGKFMAQHADGQTNTTVNQFSRDVATLLEQRRQGKLITVKSPSVIKMVDEMELSMTKMYDDLVDAGVTGFKKERRIKHYFPQLWDEGGIRGAVSTHGRGTVQRLLAKGYMNSKFNGINTMNDALHVADNFLQKMDDVDGVLPDGALPSTMDARAKQRLDIDTTTTDGDLSILDLMQTDTSTVMAKYSNRAAGQVALANKGLKSELDIEAMRSRMTAEGTGNVQHFDDAMNIIMGRPTRDGLNTALNEIKDAVSLSKMGGLGMAQAAEAGTVMARTLMQAYSDPKVFKKVMGMAMETKQGKQLMKETQALAGISNDVHLLDRQATHLDRNEMNKIEQARNLGYWVAGKMSGGNLKASAGYILAQGSGFNMIRRFERRIANASFMIDTAKTFKDGTGVMSHARMRDIGLDPEDANLKRIFRDVVSYDDAGMVQSLNLDKWDKATRENYHLAMYRDDAQVVQQTIGGEAPAWLNKPSMTILAQFKQSAIIANKKQLTRSAQFADREAVLGTMLNTAMAALTRTAKFGTLGAAAYAVTGDDSELEVPWEKDYWEPEKYVANFGFFPDMGHMIHDSFKAYDEDRMSYDTVGTAVASEIPMLGWMKDYTDIGTADSLQEKADAVKGVAILGNMQWADTLYKALETQLEE